MTAVETACALCGLDCGRHPILRRFEQEDHAFCCAGCANVYTILSESGVLASGQDFRDTELYRESLKLGLISNPADQSEASGVPPDAETREIVLQVSGLWCTACAWLIEHSLRKERGVVSAEVSFVSDLAKVKYCPQYLPKDRILARIAALGYGAAEYQRQGVRIGDAKRDLLLRMGVAGFLWMNVMTLSTVLYVGYFEQIAESVRRYLPFVLMALATPAVFYSARPIVRLALNGLRNRVIRMETLLALGILTAYTSSAVEAFRHGRHFYFDTACAIVTLVLAGKVAEQSAKESAASGVAALYRTMPRKARLLMDGRERFVSVEALQPGTVFLVRPGERIPADGVVVEGRSDVDESVLTGESVPRFRTIGDGVICGGINGGSTLHVCATKVGMESTLAQIIQAVESAMGRRSHLERQVDRISRIFTPCVIVLALGTFASWMAALSPLPDALMRSISVLVIACPCALGIATPLAMANAIGAASRRHILVTDSQVLETVRKVDTVILDKTGTVTRGDFGVLEMAGDERMLPLVASLEAHSQHPLARAVCRWAESRALKITTVHEFAVREGKGISGIVSGRRIFAGNRSLCPQAPPDQLTKVVGQWEQLGHTVIYFGSDSEVSGALAFGDEIRPEASTLAAELKKQGIRTLLVSGDAGAATRWVGTRIGVDEVVAEAVPEQKASLVRSLQKRGNVVAMVGDGVNDSPSLAEADFGIALSSGTDIAIKAAPLVIPGSNLLSILAVFDLARKSLKVVRQNLFWAFFYNGIGIPLAAAGIINPILAAGAMVMSSLSVIYNSKRIR